MIFDIEKAGEGGESAVWIGDVPGANVVIKCPLELSDIENAMDETHLIEVLYDWFK